jgi:hypothetical protein
MRFFAVCVLLASICGCAPKPFVIQDSARFASAGTRFNGQATVYVMRDASGAFMAWPINILLDQKEVGSLRRETYTRFAVASGRHDVVAHWNPLSGLPDVAVNSEFEAGQTYYFVFGTSFGVAGPFMQYGTSLGPVDPRLGAELAGKYDDWTPNSDKGH